MNYYAFHIGDYAVHTRHLSLMEDLAYRRLLDLYYTRESGLPADAAAVCRLIGMRDQQAEVETVLSEFFTKTEAGWSHYRCDAEIAKAQAAAERARSNGTHGGRPKKTQTEPTNNPAGSKLVEANNPDESNSKAPNPNPNPITQNQITPQAPRKREGSFDAKQAELPEWLPAEAWGMWCDDRRDRGKPVSRRAVSLQFGQLDAYRKQGHAPESVIRHSIAGGFQGLYPPQKQSVASITVPGPTGPDPALEKIKADSARAAQPSLEVLARLAELKKPKVNA